jgi:hypothetical protein
MSGSIWERFTLDPRLEENARLRAADRDRDVVNDLLGTAYSEGRLTPEELDERSDRVVNARTLGELPAVIDDLVAPTGSTAPAVRDLRAEAERRYLRDRQEALWSFLGPTLICWVIWFAVMPGGFPWPLFVMLGTGLNLLRVATSRESTVQSIQHDLEKKERKRLEARQAKKPRELGHDRADDGTADGS